ncbi:hypothetical protein [Streptomyces sp. NPDC058620]|uniref:hypothetical protein n=1 Tax=Streptomyces sp. NPDC058620 TaxID=3346560 RepID=UPI00365F8AA8
MAAVLRDQDTAMAQSAVVCHIDRRADRLLTDSRFAAWVRTMARATAGRDLLARRLTEWTLLNTIELGRPWVSEELTAAAGWCRRTAITRQVATSPDALRLLAVHGRPRRVRNAASHRLRHPEQTR